MGAAAALGALAAAGRTVTVSDGRRLCYAEYGDTASGFPVLFFHGNLNSRLFAAEWGRTAAVTAEAGARVIAVERPGVGGSSPHPDRTYTTWVADIAVLVAALGLRRFAALGFSSGGPHAVALAAAAGAGHPVLAGRLSAVGLVSSDGPYWLMGGKPMSEPRARAVSSRLERDLRSSYEAMRRSERRVLAVGDLDNAISQGHAGPAQDTVLERGVWDIDLSAAARFGRSGGRIFLWHGEDDADVPVAAARELLRQLGSGVTAVIVPKEVHSIIRRRWGEALRTLVRAGRRQAGARL
eukprot:TRINITY_DN34339_c0_g1_i1.p2 TRINITY_DN34339_c0_g1~~TRINITY_DN34339_c0_g1_i1.p2  ORF type:complete len:323 (+),score=97.74 TRINITY_DN34339_c0_g1_i1:84-971(+)